jgi:hypothetical protein
LSTYSEIKSESHLVMATTIIIIIINVTVLEEEDEGLITEEEEEVATLRTITGIIMIVETCLWNKESSAV